MMKTEFVPKLTTVVASCCVVLVGVSLSDRLLTIKTLASTGYLDAFVTRTIILLYTNIGYIAVCNNVQCIKPW